MGGSTAVHSIYLQLQSIQTILYENQYEYVSCSYFVYERLYNSMFLMSLPVGSFIYFI